MRDIVVDIPLEHQSYDEPLFEYTSFRKTPKIRNVYLKKVKVAFSHNIATNNPIFKPQSSSAKKHIVIKNIGNMKKAHLKNALSYTIDKSYQEYVDLFGNGDENSLDDILKQGERCGIDYLGNFVSVEDILKDWQKDFSDNINTNEALHLVFSLNELKSDSLMDILLESTKATMQSNFPEYKYVLVPHAHQNQPHIHIIINKTNIFSGKKLHFKSKQECASFYDGLREDFKQNLFVLSNGKLDYTNDVRFDKDFRQEHLESKIKALESFNDTTNDYEKDMAFLEGFKSAIDSVNAKYKFYTQQNLALRKEIKNKSIYLHNIEAKIEALRDKNPTKLKYKRFELIANLCALRNTYQRNEQHKERLDQHIRRFLDWEDTYKSFCKNFNLHNKKKSLVRTFKGYEQYLPVNLIEKLNVYKRDVARFEQSFSSNADSISEGVSAGIMDYNPKTNIFKLCKKLSKFRYYTNIVSSIAFPENKSTQAKKEAQAKILEQSLENLLESILKRTQFALQTLLDSQKEYEKRKNMLNPLNDKDFISDATLIALQKRIDFLSKEINVGKQVLTKYNYAPFKDMSVKRESVLSKSDMQAMTNTQENLARTQAKITQKHTSSHKR